MSKQVENLCFIVLMALISCALFANIALQKMDIVPVNRIDLGNEEVAVPFNGDNPVLKAYHDLFERVRVKVMRLSYQQFPGYVDILEANNQLNVSMNRALYDAAFKDNYQFIPVKGNVSERIYLEKDNQYLLKTATGDGDWKASCELFNQAAERHPDVRFYNYTVMPPTYTNILHEQGDFFEPPTFLTSELSSLLSDKVPNSYFKYDTLEEYHKYFFSTDHHWNFDGAYRGYQEVIELMQGQNPSVGQPLKAGEKRMATNYQFMGSMCRETTTDFVYDTIFDYKIDLPPHKVWVTAPSGKVFEDTTLSPKREPILNGTLPLLKYDDMYTYFFVLTTSRIDLEFPENHTGNNLLVFSDSMSNPIKDLLASHYDKTYYIDVRQYPSFRMDQFIEENAITDVLFMYGNSMRYLADQYPACFS